MLQAEAVSIESEVGEENTIQCAQATLWGGSAMLVRVRLPLIATLMAVCSVLWNGGGGHAQCRCTHFNIHEWYVWDAFVPPPPAVPL